MKSGAACLLAFIANLGAASAETQTHVSAADFALRAEKLVDVFVQKERFSGAVLVARDGKIIFEKGFALANREWDIPVTLNTEFRLGSLTKQFTAVAILQLIEQGKVNLSDPISKYYKNAPPSWGKITIDNLLSHRSGIPEYTITNNFLGTLARLDQTPESIMNTVRDKPLDFEPGTKYKYDNTGYVVLGYIVERASGESYPEYLRNHIFLPLGMSHTGYDIDGNILPHRAAGYVKEGSQWRNASFIAMSVPFAGGGLYSDVQDLITWDDALHSSRLLKPMSEKAMFTDHGDKYGFGVVIDREKGRVSWHHSGVINGFHGYLVRYPDQHLTVVLLSNYQGAPVETIAGLLTDLAFGEPVNLDAVDAPRPGNEAVVRRLISQFQSGTIDFTQFDPQLAAAIRPRADTTVQTFRGYGALKSLKFGGRDDDGMDYYVASFENGEKEFHIYVDNYGTIRGLTLRSPPHS